MSKATGRFIKISSFCNQSVAINCHFYNIDRKPKIICIFELILLEKITFTVQYWNFETDKVIEEGAICSANDSYEHKMVKK